MTGTARASGLDAIAGGAQADPARVHSRTSVSDLALSLALSILEFISIRKMHASFAKLGRAAWSAAKPAIARGATTATRRGVAAGGIVLAVGAAINADNSHCDKSFRAPVPVDYQQVYKDIAAM